MLTRVIFFFNVWVTMKLLPLERRGVPESVSERRTLTQVGCYWCDRKLKCLNLDVYNRKELQLSLKGRKEQYI